MDKHLENWLEVIKNMANDNTYKLAWGRGIVECALTEEYKIIDNQIEISFFSIAQKMLKYYWNQEFFFSLKQGPNIKKPPIIYQITLDLIEKYTKDTKSSIPVWFDKALSLISTDSKYYDSIMKRMVAAVNQDVCWRFLLAGGNTYSLYELDRKHKWIRISQDSLLVIKDYGLVLIQLFNYRWAQLLEQFNRSPKIVAKVKGSQENKIRRESLAKYKEILLKQFENKQPLDFYTGYILEEKDISVDHVIPWSFMYSDDIWNMVLTSKSTNSSKSKSTPNEVHINRLITRNIELSKTILDDKFKLQLIDSLEKDYVHKYYLDLNA